MTTALSDEELYELYELLSFLVELCASRAEELNVALCRHTRSYFPAARLCAELIEHAERLASVLEAMR